MSDEPDPILHPSALYALVVAAAEAASDIEALPDGLSLHEVTGWSVRANNSDDAIDDLPARRILCSLPDGETVLLDPATCIFNCDECQFVAAMRSALPDGHPMKQGG